MRKVTSIVLLFLFTINSSYQLNKESKHFNVKQLSPGVWAAINNDYYGHAICNAGIIDLGDRTVVFDPFMNIDAARDLKIIAKELTGKDASIVINSHYHNDHVRGNQEFFPSTIISTNWTRSQMAISEPQELAWEKENAPRLETMYREKLKTATGKEKEELPLWIGYYEAMVTNGPLVKTTLPNFTFNDSLWIHGSERSLLLVEYKNGHTQSDLIMFLPKEGIAFMGDLFFEKRHPYLADGNPGNWVQHLKKLYADTSLHQFVPGHGNVSDKTGLKEMTKYITDLQELVDYALQQKQPDSLIKKSTIPPFYTDWKFGQFFSYNVNFLLKQKNTVTK